jgi:hypothetical protein
VFYLKGKVEDGFGCVAVLTVMIGAAHWRVPATARYVFVPVASLSGTMAMVVILSSSAFVLTRTRGRLKTGRPSKGGATPQGGERFASGVVGGFLVPVRRFSKKGALSCARAPVSRGRRFRCRRCRRSNQRSEAGGAAKSRKGRRAALPNLPKTRAACLHAPNDEGRVARELGRRRGSSSNEQTGTSG